MVLAMLLLLAFKFKMISLVLGGCLVRSVKAVVGRVLSRDPVWMGRVGEDGECVLVAEGQFSMVFLVGLLL